MEHGALCETEESLWACYRDILGVKPQRSTKAYTIWEPGVKTKHQLFNLILLTALIASRGRSPARAFSAEDLARRTVERRAVESVIWGMPAVDAELLFPAAVQAKGGFNQVVYWSRPVSWKNQTLTPNPDTIYLMPFYNTKDVGPMVLEIQPAGEDGSITGSIDDAWQTALEDVGPAGVDQGKGGKYLILPPDCKQKVPDGYIARPSATYAGFVLLRSNLRSGGEAEIARAVAYGKRIKFYPLSQAGHPRETKFVDAIEIAFDSTIPYDLRFFEALNRFVQREPWLTRDKVMIDSLKSIGIEKSKPFNPDANTQKILNDAAREAHAWLDLKYASHFATPYNEGARWALPADPEVLEGLQTDFANPNALIRWMAAARAMRYGFFQRQTFGRGPVLSDDHRGQRGPAPRRRRHVSPERPGECACEIILVSDGIRPRATHALIRSQPWVQPFLPSLRASRKRTPTDRWIYILAPGPWQARSRTGSPRAPVETSKSSSVSTVPKSRCSTRPGSCPTSS